MTEKTEEAEEEEMDEFEDVELEEEEQPTLTLEIPISHHHEVMVGSLDEAGMEAKEQLAAMLQRHTEEQIHELMQAVRYNQ